MQALMYGCDPVDPNVCLVLFYCSANHIMHTVLLCRPRIERHISNLTVSSYPNSALALFNANTAQAIYQQLYSLKQEVSTTHLGEDIHTPGQFYQTPVVVGRGVIHQVFGSGYPAHDAKMDPMGSKVLEKYVVKKI